MKLSYQIKSIIVKLFVLIDKLIYCIFRCFTKIDKQLVILEGQMGGFDESSWELYHYLRKKNRYKFVWMVNHPEEFPESEDTVFVNRYHYTFNILADYYYAKAGYSFYTHTTSSIRYKREGQTKVYIGHGYAIKGGKGNSRTRFNNFDYALATGEGAIKTQASFIGCEERELLPLGLPRNDLLVRNIGKGTDNPFAKDKPFKKVIIWMPTFRDSRNHMLSETSCATETGLPLFDTEEKVIRLNEYLQQCGCGLLLKIHRLQMQKSIFKMQFSNIIMVTNEDVDRLGKQLYEIVGYSDALLTDYSSISVDYLLVDKPIGYMLSDIESYKKDRGFTSENPLDVMAGEYIYTQEDFNTFIANVLNDIDPTNEQRKQLVQKLHAAAMGNSCELIEKALF